jgi:hypothetical protein
MRKLGVITNGEQVTEESWKRFDMLFDKPLEKKHLAAI